LKFILLAIFLTISSLSATQIKVAVAANVSYAINSLIEEFNTNNPNIQVVVILGSSGKLTAQISHGAPYDLFMSANMNYPNKLYEKKIAKNKPTVYALGSLALLSTKNLDLSKNLDILKNKKIKRVAIANPKTAPYGIAAFEALKNANILDEIKSKFVYGESISQTVSYTVTATDIGIIAKSSLYSPHMKAFKKDVNWVEIDSTLYTPIKQGIVILKNSNEVKAFYDFILGKKAKKIFENYGYLINE